MARVAVVTGGTRGNGKAICESLKADGFTVVASYAGNDEAAKRFRKTGSGKFKCGHAFKSHILTKKSTKRKRGLRAPNHVRAEDAGRVARMLPYA